MAKRSVHHNQTTNVATLGPRNAFPSLPERFGRYILQEEIGSGGMGRVFRATHATLKQVVALKTIRDDRFEGDDQILRRFYREIEAAGAVIHPHVARATDAGEERGIHFLITEYIDGIDLQALTQRTGGVSAGVACELAYQTCLGLEAIRSQGMIHRDIKPSNLLVTWDGQVKIVDLGLARILDASISSGQLTGSNTLLGTLDFIAPEQALCARDIDIRADLYSLGCTVIWLLTGRSVFGPPDYRFPAQKIRAHCDVEPNWNRLPPLEDGVLNVLKRLLAKRPGDRFETPAQVAEALKPYRDETTLGPLLERVREEKSQDLDSHAVTETVSYEYDTTVPRKPTDLWKRYGTKTFLVAGALLLLVIGVYFWNNSQSLFSRNSPRTNIGQNPLGTRRTTPPPRDDLPAKPSGRNLYLDKLPAWQWHDLLEHPPSQRIWKSSSSGTRWYYDPELKQISVSCGEIGLLDLAQISSGNYTMEMGLYQGRLSGGLGLYIGAHIDEHEGREVIRYQYFEILKTKLGSKDIFMLSRNLGIEPVKSNGDTTVTGTRRAFVSKEFDRDFGSQRLEIKVTQNQLEYVMINGKKLKELATPEINKRFEPEDYKGGLGVWVFASDGVVQKAQIIRNDGQP